MGLFDTLRCEYPLPEAAHQDLEFLDGRIPGDRKLLLLLLTSVGLRRTAAMVGRERWLQAIGEERG